MWPRSTLLIVLAVLGLVPGCAEVSPAPLSAEASAGELEGRTLDDPRLRTFLRASLMRDDRPGGDAGWNLTALTIAAIYYHPELDLARARLALARAGVITAGQSANPVLNLSAELDTAGVPGAIPAGALPLTIGPVINLVVESFGKREYRTAQAQHLAEAAEWALSSAGWRLRGQVRTALLDLWAARRRMALSGQRLDLQEELVRLLEKRLAAGAANSLEVSRERIARARIALARGEFEQSADKAEAQLAAAIGVPLRAVADKKLGFDAFEHPRPAATAAVLGELRRRALTGRADVQAALADYEAAQAGLQLAVANQYPNLALGPGYVYDSGLNRFSLSPAIELPIFHQNQGQIAEALAKRQQAAASFTTVQSKIIAAIDSALAAWRAARRELATAAALLASAQRRGAQTAAAFSSGQVDRPDLVTAELETADVRLARVDAVMRQLQALGALEDALEQPLFEAEGGFTVPPVGPRPGSEPLP